MEAHGGLSPCGPHTISGVLGGEIGCLPIAPSTNTSDGLGDVKHRTGVMGC
jgi:hypothetical protein